MNNQCFAAAATSAPSINPIFGRDILSSISIGKICQCLLVAFLFLLGGVENSWGQLLQWNTFGNTGMEATEPSVFNATGISAVDLTLGAGVDPDANGNRLGGKEWFDTGDTDPTTLAEAIADNDYIEFVVTPTAGYFYNATSLVFNWERSETGPGSVTLRSSIDGYVSDIGSVTGLPASLTTGNTITITGHTGLVSAVTFRLYAYAATTTGGTGGFDVASNIVNVELNGSAALLSPTSVSSDYFRSKVSGDWGTPATWESSTVADFSSGLVSPATLAPNASSSGITIRNTHNVTVSGPVTADQIVVDAGGTLTQNASLTLANGTGDDLTVNGTWEWKNGLLGAPGNAVVSNTGTLNLTTVSAKWLGANLTNGGTIDWQNGVINFFSSATITNNALWNITSTSTTAFGDSYGHVVNNGAITKTSIGNSDFAFVQTFTNNPGATINCNAGNLRFGGAGNPVFTNAGALAFSGGIFTINGGATLNYNASSTVSGTGTFNNNGTLNLNVSIVFPSTINVTSTTVINGVGDLTINSDFIIQNQINGPGLLTINANSTWTYGTLDRPFTVENSRTLTLNTNSTKSLFKNLTNNGTIEWQDGLIAFYGAPTITNNALWNITGNNNTTFGNSLGTITNSATGTITKTSVGTTSFTNASPFNNSGTINFNGGTIAVGGVGATIFTNTGALVFNTGAFINQPGTTLNYNAGSSVSGAGAFTNSATLNLNTDVVFPASLVFASTNTINGAGNLTINNNFTIQGQVLGAGTLTINANSTWTGGALYRVFTVEPTRTMTINTASDKYLGASLTNSGTIDWQAGLISYVNTPTITNNALWTITGNNLMQSFSSNANITNTGTITKSSNAFTTISNVTNFLNSGTINCNSGTFSVAPAFVTTLTNTGTLNFSGGAFEGGSQLTFNHNAGAIIKGTGTFTLNGTFNKNGIIAPGASPGILAMNGVEPFSANTTINIEVLDNSGPGTGHDQITRLTGVTLAGTLNVTQTGIVNPGTFTILTLNSGTITGAGFTVENLPACYTRQVTSNAYILTKSAPPVVSCPSNSTVCISTPAYALSGGMPTGGVYTGTGVSGGNFDPATAGAGTHTITYTVTEGNMCTNTCTFTITVDAQPIASAGDGGNECDLDFVFNATPSVGIGTWTAAGPGIASYTPDANSPTATATVTAYGTYTFTWTEINGTCSDIDVVIVDFYAQPTADAGMPQIQCNTPTFAMAAVPSVGTGAWTFVGPFGTSVITTPTSATTTVTTVPTDMNITLRWTETNGICSDDDDVVIRNDAQPVADAGTNQTQCNTPNFTMAAVPSVGTGAWTFIGPFGTAVITSPTSATTTIETVPTDMNIVLRWTETNGTCSDFGELVIRNDAQPLVGNQPNQEQCNNEDFNMTQSAPSVGTGVWTLENGSATITNASSPTTTITGVLAGTSATVRWTVTNGSCSAFDEVTIANNALPVVTCPGNSTVCLGDPAFTLTGASPATGTYSGDGVSGGMFDPADAGAGTHTITYSYTDGNGCTNMCTFTISVTDAEIALQSLAFFTDIFDGDNTPDIGDDTEFGSVDVATGSVTHTFSVNNDGTTPLVVSSISLSGANPGDFFIGSLTPASPIPPASTSTFTITFDPTANGLRTATVNINNNDCDETPFDFAVQGTGTSSSCSAITNLNTSETFCSIQEAIDDAQTLDGHVITVASGTYPEHVIITKELDIRGPNYGISGTSMSRGAEALIVPEATLMPGDPWTEVVYINSSNVSFDGFKISGDNPSLSGYAYAGMDLDKGQCVYSEGSNVQFRNNIVEKATTMGFYAGGAQIAPHYSDLLVSGNKFENIHDINQLGYGFAMYIQATTGLISNNTVENSRTGIQVQPYDVISAVTPVVTGNTFNVWRSGIYYNYAENGATAWNINSNIINAINPPVTPTGPVRWQGIAAETIRASSNGGTLSGNTINGYSLNNPLFWWTSIGLHYAGAASTSTALVYSGNAVSGVKYGMVHDAPADITFTGNNLAAAIQAIAIQRQYNSAGVQQPTGGTGHMDATGGNTINGVASGAATLPQLYDIEDDIYHKVDSCIFGLVRVRPQQIYVTVNSSSVQCGIDAASPTGDKVNIKAGNYASSGMNASAREVMLAPGSSPGCVTLGSDMVLTSGDQLDMELNGTVACTEYDRFVVNGTVTLGGANLNIILGYMPSNLDEYIIITNNLSDPVSGTFAQGSSLVVGPYTFVINYAGGDGNDVVLEMCTGETTISTPTLVVENMPMLPASVPDVGVGSYVWSITNGTITGGQGTSSISYTSGTAGTLTIYVTVTDENGCVSTDEKVVDVIAAGPSSMVWVLDTNDNDTQGPGSCPDATNCCEDIICYDLVYTPAVSGKLTTYTTGFISNCLGPVYPPPIALDISMMPLNNSCVMSDNSFEFDDCTNSNSYLFNSSGQNGNVTVVAGVAMTIHKVCFNIKAGEVIDLVEDIPTDLTASIDFLDVNNMIIGQYTDFPAFTPGSIIKPLPVIPANVTITVSCESHAVLPVPPTVLDFCGNPVTVALSTTVDNPMPVTCEGTRVYYFIYTDCAGTTYPWSYTYIIDDNINPTASNPLPVIVECFGDIPAFDITVVTDEADNCGGIPDVSYISDDIISAICDGAVVTVTRTYRVTDCAGNTLDVFQTISVDDVTPPSANTPAPISVECFSDIPAPNPIVVTGESDNCLGTPGVAFFSDNVTSVSCDGATVTVTRTYRVTDCSGNTMDVFQTISVDDVTNPTASNPPTIAVQCFSDIPTPDPLVVTDEADNCDGVPIVTHVGDDILSVVCDGATVTMIRTYQVADCSGNLIQVTQTFNVNDVTPPAEVGGPVPTSSTVGCPLDAVAPHLPGSPSMPVVEDICGNILTASAPVQGGSWSGGCTGTITFSYTYTSCSGLPFVWVYTYTVDCDPLTLKVLLEGPYVAGTGTMSKDLNLNHLLPGQDKLLSPSLAIQLGAPFTPFGQPYSGAPWNYSGNTGLNFGDPSSPGAPMSVIPYDADVVDWILVTVRKNGQLPAHNHWTCAGWVHQDGEVTFPESCGTLSLNGADNYYVMVQHRNHLGILSPSPVLEPCSGYVIDWDFTASNSYQPTFRYGQKMVDTGIWAMHAANGEQITSISAISSADRTTWRLLQGVLGYSIGDYNLSTVVTPPDETVWKTNQNRTSGVIFY